MNSKCILCKGRGYCGRVACPIIQKSEAVFKIKKDLKKDFFGESPTPFIGRYGYPFVNVGILSPTDPDRDVWKYDAPRHWARTDHTIRDIIGFRSELVNSRKKTGIMETNRITEIAQEIGIAKRPVELEINLKDRPEFKIKNDSFLAPTGPNAQLVKANITSNPNVDTRVDRIISDTDLKSKDGILELYKKGFDENIISRILSVGTLGLRSNRKLVPTRWSITATDDNIGKEIISQIQFNNHTDHLAYFGGFFGNYYLILMFSDAWSYELFETYMPNSSWNSSNSLQYTTDYESYSGRKTYAYNCAGGYYAARLPILEKLKSKKRQAQVLAIRVITGEYTAPLGVWVCREATRKAIENPPLEFASKELMITYARHLLKKKFGIDADILFKKSNIMENQQNQSKITQFLG